MSGKIDNTKAHQVPTLGENNKYPNEFVENLQDARGLTEYLTLDLPMGLNRFGIYRGRL